MKVKVEVNGGTRGVVEITVNIPSHLAHGFCVTPLEVLKAFVEGQREYYCMGNIKLTRH
jgi:hypothetical protein